MRALWITMIAMVPLVGCTTIMDPPDGPAYMGQRGWVLSVEQVRSMHPGGAIFLDARPEVKFKAGHLDGAHNISWKQFSEPADPRRGRLLADDALLTSRLRGAGVMAAKQVVVLGDAITGWGEDGRIVWMLRTLGHTRAALLDGGHYAAEQAGLTVTTNATPPATGDFTVARSKTWDIQMAELQKIVLAGPSGLVGRILVDTREDREYLGAVPYGESRGGHLPGAVHLHYSSLLNSVGGLRDRETLLVRLKERGITPDREVIAYCTGGIRSGWFVAVLSDLGFATARNYAGSMWEWSAGPADQYPRE